LQALLLERVLSNSINQAPAPTKPAASVKPTAPATPAVLAKPAAPAKSAAPAKPVAPASAKPAPAAPATESATTIPKRKQAPMTDSSQSHKTVSLEQIAVKLRTHDSETLCSYIITLNPKLDSLQLLSY